MGGARLLVALAAIVVVPEARAEPAETKIGAFVTSLADISESQRRFEITFWAWMLSPETIGEFDPARSLEVTNATTTERQYAVTTAVPGGRRRPTRHAARRGA